MINTVRLAMPQYSSISAFKATPQKIAKDALAVEINSGEARGKFGSTYEDEKIDNLRNAARLIRKTKSNPNHPAAKMIDSLVNVLEE